MVHIYLHYILPFWKIHLFIIINIYFEDLVVTTSTLSREVCFKIHAAYIEPLGGLPMMDVMLRYRKCHFFLARLKKT